MVCVAMLKSILAGVVLSVLMTGGAAAQLGAILSSGTLPCGDFVAAPEYSQNMFVAWALGYISGENVMDAGDMKWVGSSWTSDSVTLWLKNYCSQHALASFAEAAEKLRQELAAQEGRLPK